MGDEMQSNDSGNKWKVNKCFLKKLLNLEEKTLCVNKELVR